MGYIYNQHTLPQLPYPAQCSKCGAVINNDMCKCNGEPTILYWTVKPEEENYWFMDGSVKPIEVKISELKKYHHETV